MKMESLLTIGVFIVALSLLGGVLAMALGMAVTLSRRAGGIAALDRVEPPLRRVAATFGYSVEGARTIPERRVGERRSRGRALHQRGAPDRRHRERRLRERRAREQRHQRAAASRR